MPCPCGTGARSGNARTAQPVKFYYRAMCPAGYLVRWPAVGGPGAAPAAPAATTLTAVAARTASLVRCVAIGCMAVQAVIWHGFYGAAPWRLAGPAAVAAWAAVVIVLLRRRRLAWQMAVIDSGAHVALALCAGLLVPPVMSGDTANWLYILMAAQLVVPAWFAPTAVFVPLALASGCAYWAGAVLEPEAGAGSSSPAAAGILLLAVAAVAWWGRRMLARRAAVADLALAEADRASCEQYVVLSRNTERREHERLLHDTVLNTLTALARGGKGGSRGVVGQCRHDVTLMEHALSDAGDPVTQVRPPPGGLLSGIEAIAGQMRARGLDVHVETVVGAPAVPAPVIAAMMHSVREALVNVANHAGTGEAWVEVSAWPPAARAADPGGLQVSVRDTGVGFDPAHVDPARLGLRRSIIERIAECGGQAIVTSAPGQGTVVSLRWIPPAEPGRGNAGDGAPAQRQAKSSRGGVVWAAYETELPRMAGAVAVIWQSALVIQVLVYLHDYRQPAVPVAVWLGMLAAAGWLVPRAFRGGLGGADAAIAIAVAVAAVVLIGWDRRAAGAAGTMDWSVAGTGWLLALVALSRPAWVWVLGAALVLAAHVLIAVHRLGVSPDELARLAATAYTVVVILVVFAALRVTVRTYAGMAARRAELASRSAAERAAAAAVREDRRSRLALLEMEALPLLRGIAGGTLDPADSEVRERCSRHAATLRRALSDRPLNAGPLLAELEPAFRAARARGVPMEVRVVGDPGHPPREVTGATLTAVGGVMSALPPHPVTLTVLASGEDVELYVTFDQPPQAAPDVRGLRRTVPTAAGWRASVDVDDSGAGCLEIRWRKTVPA